MAEPLWAVVNTDNFGGDYPDEKFVGDPYTTREAAEKEANFLNSKGGDMSRRYNKVVELPYKLVGGFEP